MSNRLSARRTSIRADDSGRGCGLEVKAVGKIAQMKLMAPSTKGTKPAVPVTDMTIWPRVEAAMLMVT